MGWVRRFSSVEFLEAEARCCLAEALAAQVDAVLADVRPGAPAADAFFRDFAELAGSGHVVLMPAAVLAGLVPDLDEDLVVARGGHGASGSWILTWKRAFMNSMASWCVTRCAGPMWRFMILRRLMRKPGRSSVTEAWKPMMPMSGSYLALGTSMYS